MRLQFQAGQLVAGGVDEGNNPAADHDSELKNGPPAHRDSADTPLADQRRSKSLVAPGAGNIYQFVRDEQGRNLLRNLLIRTREDEDYDRLERWLSDAKIPELYKDDLTTYQIAHACEAVATPLFTGERTRDNSEKHKRDLSMILHTFVRGTNATTG